MDDTELQFKLADKLYDFMREKNTDISDIAANLGFKADNIKKCKDHIFQNKHLLDQFAELEDSPEYKCFDANLEMS